MHTLRALVVDDEPMVRAATVRALVQQGFECEQAANGLDALDFAQRVEFDLVVTDLRMPVANGHELAVNLLRLLPRPLISILTGVHDPRLAKDLSIRGVDNIYYKPVEYPTFAANARALVQFRTSRQWPELKEVGDNSPDSTSLASLNDIGTVSSMSDIDANKMALASISEATRNATSPPSLEQHTTANTQERSSAFAATQSSFLGDKSVQDGLRTVDSHLKRIARVSDDVQRAVTSLHHQSYVHLGIAVFAGLLCGLIFGWIAFSYFTDAI